MCTDHDEGLWRQLIRAVTFDLWNTLISDKNYADSRVEYLANVLNRHGTPRHYQQVMDAYLGAHDYAHRVWVEENYRYVPCPERLGFILKRLGVDLPTNLRVSSVKMFEETMLKDPPLLVEDARNALEQLSPDYRMGIISDTGITPGRILRLVLKDVQVLNFFKCTVFSDEMGYNKPHRIMFETALKVLGCKPSEALHIGDLLQTDVAGAKAIGMKAAWLNIGTDLDETHQGPTRLTRGIPDFEIRKLTHLLDVLKGIH